MFKRIAFFLILILFAGHLYAWQIDDFQVNVEINKDSSIIVTEKILADFSEQAKHGIFRNIPIQYRDEKGNLLGFALEILGIYDESGSPWQYSESYSGIYKILKIGSPYKTYTTQKTFIIKYKVRGAILYLDNHDELFWNAIGTEWDAPINNVTINVHLPGAVKKDLLMTAVYSGKYGSRASNVQTQILDEQNITFTGARYMPYEGVTIVVGWPKGIVEVSGVETMNTPQMYTTPPLKSYRQYYYHPAGFFGFEGLSFLIAILIPIIVFFIMFCIWRKYGKDPKLQKSIVVEYKVPEGLTPAEMGTLIDDRIDIRDISSTIIDLAVRGYLKIVQEDKMFFRKGYSFVKLKDCLNDGSLNNFEKTVLNGLFNSAGSYAGIGDYVGFSSLEYNFYTQLTKIKKEIFERLKEKGFYLNSPEKIVLFYRVLSIIVGFFAFFLFMFAFPFGIGLGISAIIIFAFAKYMPAKTQKGIDVFGEVLGFEEFLMRTDKDKIQFEERQNIFEKMLPYAICLGISSQWARIFADLYRQPPSWFVGDYKGGFSMDYFIHDLNRSMASMNSTFTSVPRSVSSGGGFGGGGFGGGGFGGGGGSSW